MTEIVRACVRVCVNIDVFLALLYYHDQDAKSYRPLSRRLDRCDRVIQNESRDPFGGNVYVTMQITFLIIVARCTPTD